MDSICSTNQFSTLSLDLNTKFNYRCQSDWGRNNLISFVSLDGIYILKPQPENQDGPFQVQLIRNLTNKFSHNPTFDNLGPTFDKKWSLLDNHQYMQVFLDPSLASHVSNLSPELYPRRFRMAKWSPVVRSFPKECILAALTTDYQLVIFAKKNTTWMMADLSAEYDSYSKRDNGDDTSFDTVKSKLHSLSFCNICWHEHTIDGSISLLASTILGDITIWKLVVRQEYDRKPASHRYTFIIQTILSTRIEYITSMQLVDNLLVISARDGRVVLYDLGNYLFNSNQRIMHNHIILDPTDTLWPQDNIEVLDLYLQRTRENTFSVVLSKSTNICWCTMNYVENNKQEATLTINDSFSAIDVPSAATWLRPAGNNRAVFIADDGSFCQIEFAGEQLDKNPDFEAIRTGKIDLTRMVPRGLCTSSRGELIALISSISLIYEPAKIVAPTKLTIVPTKIDSKSLMDCLKKLSDESWLKDENIHSIMDVYDSIDYIRSIFPNLNHEQFHKLHKYLTDNVKILGCPETGSQLIKLKILAFLLSKLSTSRAHNLVTEYEKVNQSSINNVFIYHIKGVLTSLNPEIVSDLTYEQMNSLKNYLGWLKTVPNGKQVIDCYSQHFMALNETTIETKEICPICQATISFDQPKYGICASGHRFARCARSLLIVDLEKGDKLSCEHCRQSYLAYLVWPLPDNLWPCIFCQ